MLLTRVGLLPVLLLVVAAFGHVSSSPAAGPTSIGGPITVDTTWIAADSPYIVTSDVVVGGDPAPTLTIEPGVTVRFAPGTALLVGTGLNFGALHAVDSGGSQPILFTSDQAVAAPGDWRGIVFGSKSRPDLSRLEGCEIEYAGDVSISSLDVQLVAIPLNDVQIRSSASAGLYVSDADLTIDGLQVSSTANEAVIVGNRGNLVLTNPTIVGSGGSGVVCAEGSALDIVAGEVSGSAGHGVHLVDCDAVLSGLNILSPGLRGVYVDGGGTLELTGSTIEGNLFVHSTAAQVTSLIGNAFPGYNLDPARLPPDLVDDYFLQNDVQGAKAGDAVEISGGVLSESVTWNRWLGLVDRYRIAADLLVAGAPGSPALLTVPSGIVFEMGAGVDLQVADLAQPAGLILGSTEIEPVVFRAWFPDSPWGGVRIHPEASAASLVLDHTHFENSGFDGVTPALEVEQQAMSIQGLVITNVVGPGLRLEGGSCSLTGLTVAGTGSHGMWLGGGVFVLDGIDVQAAGGEAGILVSQGAMVNAGSIHVSLASGDGIQVYGGASFDSNALLVENAGGYGALVSDASLTLAGGQIFAPASWGIRAFGATTLSIEGTRVENNLRFDPDQTGIGMLQDNTFTNYSLFPARLPPDLVDPYFNDNAVLGVSPGDLVEVAAGTLTRSSVWGDHAGGALTTYRILGEVTVAGSGEDISRLTLLPGAQMLFAANTALIVGRPGGRGALLARGDPDARIRFESDVPNAGPGWWRGLILTADTVAALTELDWTLIERGGGSGGSLRVDASLDALSNLLIRNSGANGVEIGAAEVLIRDSRVDSTQSGPGVLVGPLGRLELDGVRVVNAGAEGIRLDGTSLTLADVSIERAGTNAVRLTDGELIGARVSIVDPAEYGVVLDGAGSLALTDSLVEGSLDVSTPTGTVAELRSNVIDDVSLRPPRVPAETVQTLLDENDLQGTQPGDLVRVHGGTLEGEYVWAPTSNGDVATLRFESGLVVAGTPADPAVLGLAAGLELQFPEGERLQIGAGPGSSAIFDASGTEQQPVTLAATTPAGWGGLWLTEGAEAGGSLLRHVVVDRAGDHQQPFPAVEIDRVSALAEHLALQASSGVGLLVKDIAARPRIGYLTAVGGTEDDVRIEGDARPRLRQADLGAAVALAASSDGPGTSDLRETWWGDPSGPGGSGPGSGEAITQFIAYEGWLEAPPSTAAAIGDTWVSGNALSPDGTVTLSATLSETSNWTAEIVDDHNVVRWTQSGTAEFLDLDFHGDDDSHTPLPDGDYVWRIEATTVAAADAAAPVRGNLSIDASLPTGAIVSPRPGASYAPGEAIDVVGTATGAAFTSYELQYGLGLFPDSFNVLASGSTAVVDAALGTLDTGSLGAGWIVLRLLVHGPADTAELRVPVSVLGAGSLVARHPVFSPDGDGRGDRCAILGELASPSAWTLDLKDSTDHIVRSFSGEGDFVSVWWDGTDELGGPLPEGDYTADLVVGGGGGALVASLGGLVIDLTPPVASIVSPEEGDGFWGTVQILGTATDTHPGSYRLEHGIGSAPLAWASIVEASGQIVGGVLGDWDTGTTTPADRTLRLVVEDAAGNRSEDRVFLWVVDQATEATCSAGCPEPPPMECTEERPCDIVDDGDRCPEGVEPHEDFLIVEPATDTFGPGDPLLVSRTLLGRVREIRQHSGDVCQSDCYTDCQDRCVTIPVIECYSACVLQCANGLCVDWENRCELATWRQVCGTQCCVQCELYHDDVVQTSFFNRQCGLDLALAIEVRQATGTCTGVLLDTHTLEGLGTVASRIPAPLDAGDYELCSEGEVIKTFTVDPGFACRLRIGRSRFELPQDADQSLNVELTTTDGGTHLLSLHRFEDDAHTVSLPLPSFLTVPTSVDGQVGVATEFQMSVVNPAPDGTQIHWSNVILRAEGTATCEAVFDVDVVPIGCGNGLIEDGEECDDGNMTSCDGCSIECRFEPGFECGDGTINEACGEECDTGGVTGQDGCTDDCQLLLCGNGVVDGVEQCDDDNLDSCDGCSAICRAEPGFACGDGILNPSCGEECDDGNQVAGDGCGAVCDLESCGDGNLDIGEECDDGNATSCDGCSSLCLNEPGAVCGDGVINQSCGEECDDGGTASGDGCDVVCRLESCGDSVLDSPEDCDDGDRRSCDGCSSICRIETGYVCGDGQPNIACGEECDDGNADNEDACTDICLSARCGDGYQWAGVEECDDGLANSDAVPDACRSDCALAHCGDGTIDGGEICDDGAANSDTTPGACRTNCTPARCGDGAMDPWEECDDGNTQSGDGCSSTCFSELPRAFIVPGILASVLEMHQIVPGQTDIKWIDAGILLGDFGDFPDLTLPDHPSGCTSYGCIEATSIFACPDGNCPSLFVSNAYGDLWNHLRSSGYYVEPFPYDWRWDLGQIADQLHTYISDHNPTGQPVHIVAHSLGTAVTRRLVVDLATGQHPGSPVQVASAVYLAPPFAGTGMAVQPIITGQMDASGEFVFPDDILDAVLTNSSVVSTTRTWPSVYQMLPVDGFYASNSADLATCSSLNDDYPSSVWVWNWLLDYFLTMEPGFDPAVRSQYGGFLSGLQAPVPDTTTREVVISSYQIPTPECAQPVGCTTTSGDKILCSSIPLQADRNKLATIFKVNMTCGDWRMPQKTVAGLGSDETMLFQLEESCPAGSTPRRDRFDRTKHSKIPSNQLVLQAVERWFSGVDNLPSSIPMTEGCGRRDAGQTTYVDGAYRLVAWDGNPTACNIDETVIWSGRPLTLEYVDVDGDVTSRTRRDDTGVIWLGFPENEYLFSSGLLEGSFYIHPDGDAGEIGSVHLNIDTVTGPASLSAALVLDGNSTPWTVVVTEDGDIELHRDLNGDGIPDETVVPQPDVDEDGVGDATDNCTLTYNPDQADNDQDGAGDVCDPDDDNDSIDDAIDNCPFDFNPAQDDADGDDAGNLCDPDDDNDSILDDGDGSGGIGDHPCTGGVNVACDDNCQFVANPDQADGNANGRGTVCDTVCRLIIGDPGPPTTDFATIAEALAAVTPGDPLVPVAKDGCVFEVSAGTYDTPLVLDRFISMVAAGDPQTTVIDPGGASAAIAIPDRGVPGRVRIEGFTVRNAVTGIDAAESVSIVNCVVENVSGTAVRLGIGSHELEQVAVSGGTAGIVLNPFGSVSIDRVSVSAATDAGFDISGDAVVNNAVLADNAVGVRLLSGGALRMSFSTLAGNGTGLDASASAVQIDQSIVCGNTTDLIGVSCSSFSTSDVCGVDCTGQGWLDCAGMEGNLSVDPEFIDPAGGDYRLMSTSPLIDAGFASECFAGVPCVDFDGNPRAVDQDGDGERRPDLGAFEQLPSPQGTPGDVAGVVIGPLAPGYLMSWGADPASTSYRVHQGLISALGYSLELECIAVVSETSVSLPDTVPAAGDGYFYLVTGSDAMVDGTPGFGSCAERTGVTGVCP